ncbi:MAG TPA: hypothetical protein VGQ75_08295 [Thermoanaerobaculia bacterium]|nr:hypothetical protein [Thermoanaerobaculia bacterium]
MIGSDVPDFGVRRELKESARLARFEGVLHLHFYGHQLPSVAKNDLSPVAEELHSLGLGENPPSSREITRKVVEYCGR